MVQSEWCPQVAGSLFRRLPSSGFGTPSAELQLGVTRRHWKLVLPRGDSQAGAWERGGPAIPDFFRAVAHAPSGRPKTDEKLLGVNQTDSVSKTESVFDSQLATHDFSGGLRQQGNPR